MNPLLYAHPEMLTDIVHGHNKGCGLDGFIAAEGWDPVGGVSGGVSGVKVWARESQE